jgi:hypothetical protein
MSWERLIGKFGFVDIPIFMGVPGVFPPPLWQPRRDSSEKGFNPGRDLWSEIPDLSRAMDSINSDDWNGFRTHGCLGRSR